MQKHSILILFVTILLNCMFGTVLAAEKSNKDGSFKTMQYIKFLPPDSAETTIDNGLVVKFDSPSLILFDADFPGSYTQRYGSLFTTTATVVCNGVNIQLTNNTKQPLIIRWAESNIAFGQYSGIPFVDGMKFRDAGNPSATPDTFIPPGQTIAKSVYASSVTFTGDEWIINGEPVLKNNSMKITLYLKIIDAQNNAKYHGLVSPSIGIPE